MFSKDAASIPSTRIFHPSLVEPNGTEPRHTDGGPTTKV